MTTFDPTSAPIDFDAKGHTLRADIQDWLRVQVETAVSLFGDATTSLPADLGSCACGDLLWGELHLREGRWVLDATISPCPQTSK